MDNIFKFIPIFSLLFIGHINAPIDEAIEKITGKTPDAISEVVGKTVEFLVKGDYANDENLLTPKISKDEFVVVVAKVPIDNQYFTATNRAALKLDKDRYVDDDITIAINKIMEKAWTKYAAIRTIYEYQTRKTTNKLASNWRVPSDTASPIPDAVYASYMEGTEALVLALTKKTADQLVKHLGLSVGFRGIRSAFGDSSLVMALQSLKTSFLASAKRALAGITSPLRLLGESRIAMDDDEVHKQFINTLLEKAWSDHALAAATTAYNNVPIDKKGLINNFEISVPSDRRE